MRDQDVTTPTTPDPEQMTFADDTGSPTAEPTPEELQAAELSRAAREAVRQPADPRIDRQLARMGLADDEDPTQNGLRTAGARAFGPRTSTGSRRSWRQPARRWRAWSDA